jgi:hypothetical protein
MDADESRVSRTLKLVDSGMSPSAAAKELGVTRQAVDDALKRRAAKLVEKPERHCSECGATLPATARAGAQTCSGKCRVARSRRLAGEKASDARDRINADRLKLGLPPIQ